ncbi:MAG TPA: hypothetical protein VEN81_16625 [Planctomycetota bacterium]|nr:hypothetical protein [Planctomycetota bacterium]
MSDPTSPPAPRSGALAGKIVIVAIFAVGTGAGLFASIYWSRPENAVAGSFTQIHTAFLRGPRDQARRLLAPRLVMDGREVSADEFLATYTLPPDADAIEVTPCPSTPGHWVLRMKDHRYCFYREGKTWKLHWLEGAGCRCR